MLNLPKRLVRRPVLLTAIVFIAAACGGPTVSAEPTAQPTPAPTVTAGASTSVPATAEPAPVPTAQPTVEPSPTASPTRTPAPTAAPPTPTTEVTKTPAPTTSAPPETAASEVETLTAEAITFLEELTADYSPRQSGTEQELAAARFLSSEFQAMGYETHLEPFTVEVKASDVELESPVMAVPSGIRSFPITQSAEQSATGVVISVNLAFDEDIPQEGLSGNVALVKRGSITFEEKVNRVAEAGAVGAIIFNNKPGIFRGVFENQPIIPAVSISREDGLAILKLLEQGEVSATVNVETRVLQSQNVVAEKPGTAGGGDVVVLGGHYDTVEGVPGANDNGSGSATVVTVARAIADKSYPFDIRFVLFGSEELGLRGSINHLSALTQEQRDGIIAMFNFDALSTGDTIGVLGDRDLLDDAVATGNELGITVKRRFNLGNASSDHATFQEAGVPVIFFLADDISRIHTSEDRLEFVRPEFMGGSAAIGIAMLDELGDALRDTPGEE